MTEAGFTLVETLVALALGAMVVGAVLSTVKVASTGARRASEASTEAEALSRAGIVLQGDADHAVYLAAGDGRASFLGQPSAMDLPELPRDGGPPRMVQYRLENRGTETTLTRADPDPVELWRGASPLTFRFLDSTGVWQSDWSQPGLPRAFALSTGTDVLLATSLPALLPAICSVGPGPDCPLPAGEFR